MPSVIIPFLSRVQSGGATPPPSAGVPDAISNLASSAQTDTSVTLTWSAPNDNGSAITDYVVQYKEASSGTWLTFSDGTSATTGATVTGLTQLTSYNFRVAAVNGEGQGAYSNELTQSTAAPFTSDANTFFYDFTSANNTVNTIGDDTLAVVPDVLGNGSPFTQVIKDYQPLVVANGANGNVSTPRRMELDPLSQSVTNGSNGWYIALNCRADTADSNILSITRNANDVASRGQIYIPSNREFGFKAANNDGAAPNWIARGPAITLGQWYTLEMEWDLVNDTVRIWYDGALQTLAFGTTTVAMTAFPSTNPSEIVALNWSDTDIDSFDGAAQNIIFHDGVPSSTIRSEISTYLQGIKP